MKPLSATDLWFTIIIVAVVVSVIISTQLSSFANDYHRNETPFLLKSGVLQDSYSVSVIYGS